MAIETERKFLVTDDGWRASVVRVRHITDGLAATENGCKTRVRIADGVATLAIKGPHTRLGQPEFEYQIPLAEAEEIQRLMCAGRILDKSRHLVPHAGLIWEVDVYGGELRGVTLAEVELQERIRPSHCLAGSDAKSPAIRHSRR